MNSVAFTGYRPEKMPFEENMQDENYLSFREELCKVINHLIECGYTHFLSGVATGFDTWVAEAVLELQKENKDLHLECVIPCPDQDKKWEQTDKDRRQMILELLQSIELFDAHHSCRQKACRLSAFGIGVYEDNAFLGLDVSVCFSVCIKVNNVLCLSVASVKIVVIHFVISLNF